MTFRTGGPRLGRRQALGLAGGLGVGLAAAGLPHGPIAWAADDEDLPDVTAPVKRPIEDFGTIARPEPPTMQSCGPQLILVDNPEALDEDVLIGSVLYRDTVSGWVRVMTHQQNQLDEPLVVAITVTNTTDEPVEVWQRGRGVGHSIYPAVAGQVSSRDFVSAHRSGDDERVASLEPGQTWADDSVVEAGITKSALVEVRATAAGSDTEVPVLVGAVVHRPGETVEPATGPVTPIEISSLQRATYEHADRYSLIEVDLDQGTQKIAFNGAGDPESPWYNPETAIEGQYVLGHNVIEDIPSLNNGNYGALYDLRIRLSGGSAEPLGLWIQPSGGPGNHINVVDGVVNVSPYLKPTDAWLIGTIPNPTRDRVHRILLNLTGGSSGAQQLILAPGLAS